MIDEEQRAALVRIRGRVQGVSFRVWTRSQAQQLGLSGWVRNEGDGSVTALIAGPKRAVVTMLERFWKGPPGASVTAVDAEGASPADVQTGFRIAH
jgi:acylphosphatase